MCALSSESQCEDNGNAVEFMQACSLKLLTDHNLDTPPLQFTT